MTTQPEALRLADALTRAVEQEAPDDDTIVVARWFVEDAAAELRRLHEAHEWQYTMAGQRLRRIEKLEASNTELLAALKLVSETDLEGADARAMYLIFEAIKHKAQTAINKAERTTT